MNLKNKGTIQKLVTMGVIGLACPFVLHTKQVQASVTNPFSTLAKTTQVTPMHHLLSENPLVSTNKSTTSVAGKMEPNFDVSTGWQVKDYTSTLDIPVDNVFLHDATRPNTKVHYASTNFFNIGDSHFLAEKHVKLKANKKYKIKLLYGMKLTAMNPTNRPDGKVSFNGEEFTATDKPLTDQVFKKEIITDKDQDYVISIEFHSNDSSGVFLMVGYDENDKDGGIVEESVVDAPTVNAPEAKTSIVTGTGVAEDTIKVSDNKGAELGTAKVDKDGNYSVTTNRALNYNEELSVVQIDKDQHESDPVKTTVKDTIAPEKPVANDVEVSDQKVVGTAEANSTIEVKNEAGDVVGTSKADANGKFDFKLSKAVTAGETLTVTAKDEAGNVSEATSIKVVDNVAPVAPEVQKIMDTDTTLKGNTKKANCKVTVEIGDQYFYGDSDDKGDFTIDLHHTYTAGTKVKVFSTDASGNNSPTTSVMVMTDKQTEKPKVFNLGDSDTNLKGKAEKNAKVKVMIDGEEYDDLVDENGQFDIQLNHTFAKGIQGTVTATGISGKESDPTSFEVIDNTAPEVPVLNKFTDIDQEVKGKTEAKAIVDVYLTDILTGKKSRFQGVADDKGEFSVNVERTYVAKSQLEVTATDDAGNTSSLATAKVLSSKTLDMSLQSVTSQSMKAAGTTSRANVHYMVKIKNQIFEGDSDQNGKFAFDLPHMYEVGTPIHMSATDEEDATQKDAVVLPRTVTVSNLLPEMTNITGVGDPDAEVTITLTSSDGNVDDTIKASTDKDGKFKADFKRALVMGDSVTVTQVKNGVTSDPAQFFIGTF